MEETPSRQEKAPLQSESSLSTSKTYPPSLPSTLTFSHPKQYLSRSLILHGVVPFFGSIPDLSGHIIL